MKILLLFYSGTFNTLYITTLIKNQLMSLNHEVDIIDICSYKKEKLNKYDVIGIGYPIHYFNAPQFLIESLKNINITGKAYFIYKTSGYYKKANNAPSFKIYKLLKNKKNIFLNEYNFIMPLNYKQKTKDELIYYQLKYNIKHIKYMCDNLMNQHTYKVSIFEKLTSFLSSSKNIILKLNIKLYKVDKKSCIKCRKCINMCPNKNIVYSRKKRKILFNNTSCINCFRCSYICPTNSISIGLLNSCKITGIYDFLSINTLLKEPKIDFSINSYYKTNKLYFDYVNSLN